MPRLLSGSLQPVARAVDFAFVRGLVRETYSHTGAPSVDPVVVFKMALLGYLYGITSERRMAAEMRLNLAYLRCWNKEGDAP
jgi:transposase